MIFFSFFAFSILPIGPFFADLAPENCQFPIYLRGTFFRQQNNSPKKSSDSLTRVPQFEKLVIEKFAIFPWGRCARQIGPNSFILRRNNKLGTKSTKAPLCFRCFTLVKLAQNVLQSLHQNESICHKTLKAAQKSCFDAQKVSPGDGILLFRHPPLNSEDFGCEWLEGKFKLGYELKLEELADSKDGKMDRKFECKLGGRSEMSSCAGNLPTKNLVFRFKNCTFPDFEQTFQCIGSWGIRRENEENGENEGGSRFVAFFNIQTQEFRCGIVEYSDEFELKLFLSIDSSCARMTPNGENALEEFAMRRQYAPLDEGNYFMENGNSISAFPLQNCEFPNFLRGRQFSNGLRVGRRQIVHRPNKIGANSGMGMGESGGQIASICARQGGHERFLVHSSGKCGESIGFHCIWFRPRSDFLVEFRTTGIQSAMDPDICDSDEFSPWNALLDIGRGQNGGGNVACGIRGQFSTPKGEWGAGDCFSLEADCGRANILRLVAFHCQTSEIYEVNEFECLGSWHEGRGEKDDVNYIYTRQIGNGDNSTGNEGLCLASRELDEGRGFGGIELALLGKNCKRGVEWGDGNGMALERKENCQKRGENDGLEGNSLGERTFLANDDYSIWEGDGGEVERGKQSRGKNGEKSNQNGIWQNLMLINLFSIFIIFI